jgi:CHASE1-domain containing sensor protein/two-component sensor histidine kinase
MAFVAIALASLAMAAFTYLAAEEAARIKFEATADDALSRIDSRIQLHLSLLRGTDAFLTARGGDVSREEFKIYFDALQAERNFEGLRALGMLGSGRTGTEPALEQEIERRQARRWPVHPATSDGEWRMPVMLVEPGDLLGRSALGYDMFSDPIRREAMLSAIETGEPRATGRTMLGVHTQGEPAVGFLMFSALDPTGRQGDPPGMIFAAFRSQDLFKATLDKFPALPVHVEVFDGAAEPENLLFRFGAADSANDDFRTTRQLLVAGRPWVIEFASTQEFTRPNSLAVPIVLGVSGLMLAAAIALLQRYQGRAYDAATKLQETAEKNLFEKDLMLQEMKHRIKNSITRVLAIARQTASSAKDIGEFSESFSARLQAMAASQDMLTRSRWQKADLGELLRIELSQAFGKDLPEGVLSGPKVMLSENSTQALGLTFHELATNALKYGEVGTSHEALRVEWRLVDKDRRLRLSWQERGKSAIKPSGKPGFGTKLIDMNIVRELKGTISRNFRPDGLDIEIEIALDQ